MMLRLPAPFSVPIQASDGQPLFLVH